MKFNPEDAQARFNLAVAMLETKQKGVRQHIEILQQLMVVDELKQGNSRKLCQWAKAKGKLA